MENTQKSIIFETLVIRTINNGFLVEVESDIDETYAYKNINQVIKKLREIDKAFAASKTT